MVTSLKTQKSTVHAGDTVTLTLTTVRGLKEAEIYDDLGNRIFPDSFTIAGSLVSARCTAVIRFPADGTGKRTYTVYAVDADGNRSADSKKCTVTVNG